MQPSGAILVCSSSTNQESNIYISAEPAFYVGSVCKHNSERTSHVQAKVYNLYAFASFSCLAPPTFRAPAFCKSWKKVPYHNLILSKSPRITIIVQKSSDKCWNILYKWWLRFTKMEKNLWIIRLHCGTGSNHHHHHHHHHPIFQPSTVNMIYNRFVAQKNVPSQMDWRDTSSSKSRNKSHPSHWASSASVASCKSFLSTWLQKKTTRETCRKPNLL